MREALSGAGTAIDICEVIDTNLSTSSVTQEYGGIFYGLLPHRLQGVDDQGRTHRKVVCILWMRMIAHMTPLIGKLVKGEVRFFL